MGIYNIFAFVELFWTLPNIILDFPYFLESNNENCFFFILSNLTIKSRNLEVLSIPKIPSTPPRFPFYD